MVRCQKDMVLLPSVWPYLQGAAVRHIATQGGMMDAIEKWRRLTNPTCVADYGLSVTLEELAETPEGREILEKEVAPRMSFRLPDGDNGSSNG